MWDNNGEPVILLRRLLGEDADNGGEDCGIILFGVNNAECNGGDEEGSGMEFEDNKERAEFNCWDWRRGELIDNCSPLAVLLMDELEAVEAKLCPSSLLPALWASVSSRLSEGDREFGCLGGDNNERLTGCCNIDMPVNEGRWDWWLADDDDDDDNDWDCGDDCDGGDVAKKAAVIAGELIIDVWVGVAAFAACCAAAAANDSESDGGDAAASIASDAALISAWNDGDIGTLLELELVISKW